MDPDPPSTSILSRTATSVSDHRQTYTVPASPEVSELTSLVTAYTLSPKQTTQTSCAATAMNPHPPSSNTPGHGQFGPAIASLQTQGEDGQQAYMSSQSQDDSAWSGIPTQSSSDDLEHYTFSSPTAGGFVNRNVSTQSSPRSGDSPGYFNAPPWQPTMPEGHRSQNGLPPASFASRDCVPTSRESISYYPYSSAPFPSVDSQFHSQSFNGSDSSFPMRSNMPSMSDHGQSTSPCSSISGVDVMGSFPTSEPGQYQTRIEPGTASQQGSPTSSSHGAGDNGSLSPASLANMKAEEPYAQLIYRAFMSTEPRYAMTLQDIYQWFREHTDKGKSDSKGWQNSIRHNLSMNQAFTKERKSGTGTGSGDENTEDDPAKAPSSPATDSNANDRKKTTKWYLEPWAVTGGVQSTTRYRKGNPSRRGRKLSSPTSTDPSMKRSAVYAAARAASGRKGGINKFRVRHDLRLRSLNPNVRTIPLHHHYPPLQSIHHQRQLPPHLLHAMDGPYGQHFMPAGAPGMDYDFSDPSAQLYPTTMTADQQHRLIHRAPSPPIADEPVTPEPASFNIKCEPPSHLLPLHRANSSSAPGTFHYATTQDHSVVGIPTAAGGAGGTYSLHGGNVVGVYDEVAERYGWGSSTANGGGSGSGGVPMDGLPYCGAPY